MSCTVFKRTIMILTLSYLVWINCIIYYSFTQHVICRQVVAMQSIDLVTECKTPCLAIDVNVVVPPLFWLSDFDVLCLLIQAKL